MQQELDILAKMFMKLPGIGERQARRFAYFILAQPQSYVEGFATALKNAKKHAQTCSKCLRIFEGAVGDCEICSDSSRDISTIVVVEKSQDIDSFGKTEYNGLFFVLGGLIPIVQKNILEGTNISKLVDRVKKEKGLHEIILAFPITPNGEHTDAVIRETLAPIASSFEISSLGRGLSSGAELEYADAMSLNASLKKRE
jgi:recombination protein RecR